MSEITGGGGGVEVRDKHLREDLFTSSSQYISLKNRFLFSLMRYICYLRAGRSVRPRAVFLRPRSQFITIRTDP